MDTIQAQFTEESDVKLFILYLLDAIGTPLDFVLLHDISVQNGLVQSFDFCQWFPEMIDAGLVEVFEEGGRELYRATELGHETVLTLSDTLLESTRARALSHAKLLLSLRRTNSDYRCTTQQLPDGKYRFTATYLKNYKEDMTISCVCETLAEAQRMELNLERCPDTVHRGVYSVLTNRMIRYKPSDPFAKQ